MYNYTYIYLIGGQFIWNGRWLDACGRECLDEFSLFLMFWFIFVNIYSVWFVYPQSCAPWSLYIYTWAYFRTPLLLLCSCLSMVKISGWPKPLLPTLQKTFSKKFKNIFNFWNILLLLANITNNTIFFVFSDCSFFYVFSYLFYLSIFSLICCLVSTFWFSPC